MRGEEHPGVLGGGLAGHRGAADAQPVLPVIGVVTGVGAAVALELQPDRQALGGGAVRRGHRVDVAAAVVVPFELDPAGRGFEQDHSFRGGP